MTPRRLTQAQREELEIAVRTHVPGVVPALEGFLSGARPTDEEINAMRDAVGIQLVRTGLEESLEPNERGLFLEDLIDQLARVTGLND